MAIPGVGALLSGGLITLSLAPYSIWPLALIAATLMYPIMQNRSVRQAALLGWLFGLGLFGSGASWVYVSIHEFGYTPVYLAALLTFLFCGGLALCCSLSWSLYAWLSNNGRSRFNKQTGWQIILFSSIWVAGEWMRSWLLTGFPWLFIGYSQTEYWLASWAPVVGVYGISFIICFSGAVAALAFTRIKDKDLAQNWAMTTALSSVVILLWLAAAPLKNHQWSQVTGGAQSVTMIQANISQHDKWQREYLQPTMQLYAKLSEPHWQTSDLMIWPEAAIPTYYQYANVFLDQIHDRALQDNSALITGIPSRDTHSDNSYNSVVTAGNASGVYHKQRLVPFGEYIPFANLVGNIMDFFDLPMSTMSAGQKQQAPLSIQQWQSKPLICYEVVYPDFAAKAAALSDVLITVSNDSWFGSSIGPLQHLQMAQMRALENSRYVLRSTGSGVSAIIDQHGMIVARTAQFERTVLSGEFYLMRGNTPWTRFGYWLVPTIMCLILTIALAEKILIGKRQKTT